MTAEPYRIRVLGTAVGGLGGARIEVVPARLYFADSGAANALIATDPMALLIGFALDQHWSVRG